MIRFLCNKITFRFSKWMCSESRGGKNLVFLGYMGYRKKFRQGTVRFPENTTPVTLGLLATDRGVHTHFHIPDMSMYRTYTGIQHGR